MQAYPELVGLKAPSTDLGLSICAAGAKLVILSVLFQVLVFQD